MEIDPSAPLRSLEFCALELFDDFQKRVVVAPMEVLPDGLLPPETRPLLER